ncbi:DNA-binding anti-repressor SinI [Peribacillus kribbensis]|nr:DNA-binding anti-repressor SinI [Peribacillus kribbensis]
MVVEIIKQELDLEWMMLFKQAKAMGIKVEEIREFLQEIQLQNEM